MLVTVIHTAFEDTPKIVAEVNVGHRMGNEALEYAYQRTQNLCGSWSRDDIEDNLDYSEDVTVMADLPVHEGVTYGLRSTSMGDIMYLHDDSNELFEEYKVDMVGFEILR